MTRHLDLHERLIALVNEVDDAERLCEILDPQGKFLEIEIMERLLEAKQSYQDQRFTDIDQVREALADDQLFDRILQSLEQAPWTRYLDLHERLIALVNYLSDSYRREVNGTVGKRRES